MMTNARIVYYNDTTSHLATHLVDTPQLLPLIKEFLSKQSFYQDTVYIEHDVGNRIGSTDLVEVTEKDEIVYAKRNNRSTYTRFVRNRTAPLTSYFTVALTKDITGGYELTSALVGRLAPPFPDEPNATPESKSFWDKHALVFGTQAIQPGTLIKDPPW